MGRNRIGLGADHGHHRRKLQHRGPVPALGKGVQIGFQPLGDFLAQCRTSGGPEPRQQGRGGGNIGQTRAPDPVKRFAVILRHAPSGGEKQGEVIGRFPVPLMRERVEGGGGLAMPAFGRSAQCGVEPVGPTRNGRCKRQREKQDCRLQTLHLPATITSCR